MPPFNAADPFTDKDYRNLIHGLLSLDESNKLPLKINFNKFIELTGYTESSAKTIWPRLMQKLKHQVQNGNAVNSGSAAIPSRAQATPKKTAARGGGKRKEQSEDTDDDEGDNKSYKKPKCKPVDEDEDGC